jgi:hypothetical protein
MAKKVWISFPLITTSDLKDESVVTFLKGGQKKELEVEVAAFVTKWLMDRDVPFGIDFNGCGVDRTVVIESLPKRLQKILGASVPVVVETAEGAQVEKSVAVEKGAAVEPAPPEAEIEVAAGVEQVAEVEDAEAELAGEDDDTGASSEPC